jgi:hypothetical protein
MLYIYPIFEGKSAYARNLTPLENHYPEISRSFFRFWDSTITKFCHCSIFSEQKYLFKYSALRILKIFFSDWKLQNTGAIHIIFIKTNIEIQSKILITTYFKDDYFKNQKQNNKPAIHQL